MSLRGRGQESGLKAALLDWCKGRIGGYKGVQLTNLTTSWKDGLAFCALVHSIDPTALNYDALNPSEKLKNCKMAFAAAVKLGIPELLDAEDVVEIDCPEPLSMMTYISQFYHHVNGTGRNWNGSMRGGPARLGSVSGVNCPAAVSPSPKASTNEKLLYPSATTYTPPPSLSASRQASMPVLSVAKDNRKQKEADLRAQEEAKKDKLHKEERQTVERRKESEASALQKQEKEATARAKEEAAKFKLQQETERRLAEQQRRDELRAQEEKRKKTTSSQPQQTDEEERKRARLAKWAAESTAANEPTECSRSVTTAKNPPPVPAEGEEVRIKCLDDGAEWAVPIATVSRVGFEAAVKTAPKPTAAAPAKAADSSCLIM